MSTTVPAMSRKLLQFFDNAMKPAQRSPGKVHGMPHQSDEKHAFSSEDILAAMDAEEQSAEVPEPPRKRPKTPKDKKSTPASRGSVFSKITSRTPRAPKPPKPSKGETVATQPIKPYGNARPRRQPPKVVTHTYNFYRDVLHLLDPIAGGVNALIAFVLVGWFVWFHPTFHWIGVATGLGVIVVELFLLSRLDKLYRTAKPDDLKNLVFMGVVGILMLGVFGGAAFRWFELVPTMLLMFLVPMSLPGILVYLKEKTNRRALSTDLDAQTVAFNTYRDEQMMFIGRMHQQATEILANAHVTEDRLRLKEERLNKDNEQRVQDDVRRYAGQIKTAVEDTLGVVKSKEQLEESIAQYTAARTQYEVSHEHLLAQAREEARAEYEERIEQLQRDNAQARYMPPPVESSSQAEQSHGAPADHPVVPGSLV